MAYARRRAAVACRYCRHRKRRCNGARPTCGLCEAAGVECDYSKDQPQRLSQSARQRTREVSLHSERGSHSTVSLQGRRSPSSHGGRGDTDEVSAPRLQPSNTSHRIAPWDTSPRFSSDGNMGAFNSINMLSFPDDMALSTSPYTLSHLLPMAHPLPQNQTFVTSPAAENSIVTDDDAPMLIPTGHHTTTSSLFTLPTIKSLIGDYSPSLFFDLEASRDWKPPAYTGCEVTEVLAGLDTRTATTDRSIEAFFRTVHPKYPILDQTTFLELFQRTMQQQNPQQDDLAACLMVLALGDLGESDASPRTDFDYAGMSYFGLAYRILSTRWVGSFTPKLSAPLGLVLAAVYCSFISYPQQAWRLTAMASTSLQLLVARPKGNGEGDLDYEMLGRLCWTCFVIECDSLSEFHLPRSGIESAIDRMHFPNLGSRGDRDGMMFLALCSIRRLLNRIHNAVYTTTKMSNFGQSGSTAVDEASPAVQNATVDAITPLKGVLDELVRQLHAWYGSLPFIIKLDLSDKPPSDSQHAWLRLRYWSASHIIYRPCFICATTWGSRQDLPDFVARYAHVCIRSSIKYIETAIHTFDKLTHYNWMVVQACLTHSMLLATAVTSTVLQHSVEEVTWLYGRLLKALEPQESTSPSVDVVLDIIRILKHKIQLHARTKRT